MIHKPINENGMSRGVVIGLIAGGALLLFLAGTMIRNNESKNLGKGLEYSETTGSALFKGGEDLYTIIGSDKVFTALKNDIAVFGRNTIDEYFTGSLKDIVFIVDKKSVKKNDQTISFSGAFKAQNRQTSVTIELKKNNKFYLSITGPDEENIDSTLPSNSRRNQFIGSLPIEKSGFIIDHVSSLDSFTLTITSGLDSDASLAVEELKSGLGVETLIGEPYSIITPPGTGDNPGIAE